MPQWQSNHRFEHIVTFESENLDLCWWKVSQDKLHWALTFGLLQTLCCFCALLYFNFHLRTLHHCCVFSGDLYCTRKQATQTTPVIRQQENMLSETSPDFILFHVLTSITSLEATNSVLSIHCVNVSSLNVSLASWCSDSLQVTVNFPLAGQFFPGHWCSLCEDKVTL